MHKNDIKAPFCSQKSPPNHHILPYNITLHRKTPSIWWAFRVNKCKLMFKHTFKALSQIQPFVLSSLGPQAARLHLTWERRRLACILIAQSISKCANKAVEPPVFRNYLDREVKPHIISTIDIIVRSVFTKPTFEVPLINRQQESAGILHTLLEVWYDLLITMGNLRL